MERGRAAGERVEPGQLRERTMVRAASFYEFRCDGTSGERPHLQTTPSATFLLRFPPDTSSVDSRSSVTSRATLITDHVTPRRVFIAIDPSFLLYFLLIPLLVPDTFYLPRRLRPPLPRDFIPAARVCRPFLPSASVPNSDTCSPK